MQNRIKELEEALEQERTAHFRVRTIVMLLPFS